MYRLLLLLSISGFLFSKSTVAAVVYDTIYLNTGDFVAVDESEFPYFSFNSSPDFVVKNKRIVLGIGDSLYLTVFNSDIIDHEFYINSSEGYGATVNAGDQITIPCKFTALGVHAYYDITDFPRFLHMGAGGMIVVDDFAAAQFYWNIKEHRSSWNDSIAAGLPIDWTEYEPDYFTVNGVSNPNINDDVDARVIGNVGETIRIYISNTGRSIHSLHFHGYHLKIIYSSEHPNHVNRIKDTFAISSTESIILELVPDKVGEYPVHDHNLVAVSGGNIYPNGMFLTMLISE